MVTTRFTGGGGEGVVEDDSDGDGSGPTMDETDTTTDTVTSGSSDDYTSFLSGYESDYEAEQEAELATKSPEDVDVASVSVTEQAPRAGQLNEPRKIVQKGTPIHVAISIEGAESDVRGWSGTVFMDGEPVGQISIASVVGTSNPGVKVGYGAKTFPAPSAGKFTVRVGGATAKTGGGDILPEGFEAAGLSTDPIAGVERGAVLSSGDVPAGTKTSSDRREAGTFGGEEAPAKSDGANGDGRPPTETVKKTVEDNSSLISGASGLAVLAGVGIAFISWVIGQ